MKKTITILTCLLLLGSAYAQQFYLRGIVLDEKRNPLSNARILLHSTGYIYHSGSAGGFGITSAFEKDSVTISMDGYHSLSVELNAQVSKEIILKVLFPATTVQRNRLLSFTKDLRLDDDRKWSLGGETYSSLVENEFIPAKRYPETGFAIHIDKAAYSNVRRFLNMGTRVPPDAVRIEELLNYFNFGYTKPPLDSNFGFTSRLSDCPWNSQNLLYYLQVSAKRLEPEKIPPSNLVFLIDISGSMDMPNRLPLLKSAFTLLVNNLRVIDTVSIVVYGSTVGVWLPPTSGIEKTTIRKAIEELYPGGSTPGESGIKTAYRLATNQFIEGGNNRVILATDGDFNIGQKSDEDLEKLITLHQQSGIYLTCLGVGMGNYKDSKLEVLAKKGNGNFAYLDSEQEAEKTLVTEFTQTLYTVADDVFLNIRFNPEQINHYRLIGFDNKIKALADSSSDLEGGEVGSGHSLLAIFELNPTWDFVKEKPNQQQHLANVVVNYRLPADSVKRETRFSSKNQYSALTSLEPMYSFATAITMFGSLLKESKFTKNVTWNEIQDLALKTHDKNDPMQLEFISLIEKAKKLYSTKKRWLFGRKN